MRCGDCKHWQQAYIENDADDFDPYKDAVLSDLGFCQAVEGEAVCAAPRSRDNEPLLRKRDLDDVGTRMAIPCDGSGYSAALLTRDNFGCVLFEKNDQADPHKRSDNG